MLCMGASAAWAQAAATPITPTAPTVPTSTPSTTSTLTELPYQDRVIEGLPALSAEEVSEQRYNRDGLPRGYSVETTLERRGVQQKTELLGLRLTGYHDTLYWGSFSGQLGIAQGKSEAAGGQRASNQQVSWWLRQLGMPMGQGWQLDNALGQITLPVPELSCNSLRFGLPSAGMLGVSSQWRQGDGLQFTGAVGESGRFTGFPLARFETTDGRYAYLSVQDRRIDASREGAWSWSAAAAQAKDVPSSLSFSPSGQARVDADNLYLAARREWRMASGLEPNSVQINLLASRNNGADVAGNANPSASGLWVDGVLRSGAHHHQWGLFYLEPQLNWLEASVASDVRGAYWRHAWRSRQLSSESTLELISPVRAATPSGYFLSQSLRYQSDTRLSYGGTLSIRRYNLDSQSLQLYTQWTHGWGSSRLQAEVASAQPDERLARATLDHEWPSLAGGELRLATSLSMDRERRNGIVSRGHGLALSMDWTIAPGLAFSNALNARNSAGATQYTLNSGLRWQIAPQWSLNATVYAVQGNPQAGSLVQSPLTVAPTPSNRLQDKGVFVSLRYTQAAGSSQVPLGGVQGSAAGSVQGVIYLDENANGKQDASERGVAQITVVLNGRFTAETDSQGRFIFPYVAAGKHTLNVISDNLPLPWVMNNDGRQSVEVFTREATQLSLGAVKP